MIFVSWGPYVESWDKLLKRVLNVNILRGNQTAMITVGHGKKDREAFTACLFFFFLHTHWLLYGCQDCFNSILCDLL